MLTKSKGCLERETGGFQYKNAALGRNFRMSWCSVFLGRKEALYFLQLLFDFLHGNVAMIIVVSTRLYMSFCEFRDCWNDMGAEGSL